jgi:HAD superfamily hydrolase (TIGR01490 family)
VPARSAAFFDLDKTVIAKASLIAFSRAFYREGLVSRRSLARGLWSQVLFLRFGARAKTLERLRLRTLALTAGWEQERVKRIVADTLNQVAGPITYREAVDLIAEHKEAGRRVYIVSAAPEEIVEPLAEYLGAEGAIASRAVVNAGRYTGQLQQYAYGPQKAATMRQLAESDSLDLTESWAYSDSATDLPMLEAVGHPVAVNPDRALRRIAQMRGWPVLRFSDVMVVTPTGRRPVPASVIGAGGAFVLGALALGGIVFARRHSDAQTRKNQAKQEARAPRPAKPERAKPERISLVAPVRFAFYGGWRRLGGALPAAPAPPGPGPTPT